MTALAGHQRYRVTRRSQAAHIWCGQCHMRGTRETYGWHTAGRMTIPAAAWCERIEQNGIFQHFGQRMWYTEGGEKEACKVEAQSSASCLVGTGMWQKPLLDSPVSD